jgi:DNA-binding transcriptional MerR regulator
MADEIVIPDKAAFKAAEVCDLLKLQPYVLKSWENEFKDLGVSKAAGGPRVYRRVDVERAVRIRELVLREGLTLAGVRRRLEQEAATADAEDELIAEISAPGSVPATPPPGMTAVERERVAQVKQGLRELLDALSRPAAARGRTDLRPRHWRG